MVTITLEGLLKKGFNEKQAQSILDTKLPFNTVKGKEDKWFIDTFDDEEIIKIVRANGRPQIPREIHNKLMYESNRCCCICKDSKSGVIIHHIVPWEESFSHAEENLVVLCNNHHAEAHVGLTQGTTLLTDKLTPVKLREMKKRWIEEVKILKKNNVKRSIPSSSGYWFYFNPNVWNLILSQNISIEKNKYYKNLLEANIIDKPGYFSRAYMEEQKNDNIWKSGNLAVGVNITLFYDSIIRKVIEDLEFVNLNNFNQTDVSKIEDVLAEKKLFIYKGRFNFKDDESRYNKERFGKGRIRKGYTAKSENIEIDFVFDEYNCMSDSAQYSHLTGINKNTLIIGEARSIGLKGNKVSITPTVYAIGTGYDQIF